MEFLSSLFGGVKNLLGGAGQAISKGAGAIANAGQGFGSNLMGMFGSHQNQQTPTLSMSQTKMSPFSSNVGMPSTSPTTSGTGMDSLTNPDKGKKSILDQLFPGGSGQGIAGIALPAIGNMFAPKTPNIPDFNSLGSVKALQGFTPGHSTSPEYQQMIQNNTGKLREQKVRELQALYHNARPGTDYLTDSNYQRDLANLDKGIQDNMTDELAKAEGTFSQQEQDKLSQIAQMDIYSIMAQTGMKAQEAQQFKEMFSNIGNVFLTNATKNPNNMSEIMKLFGGA